MKRVPAVFTVSPPGRPDQRRISRARYAYERKARFEYNRRRFLRRVEP